jgi:pyruvate/2-oxoglutarate/acetoin dehydrogenase E1 component
LAAPDVPVPYSPVLEELLYPTVEGIVSAILRLLVRPSRTSALRAFA